MNHRRSSVADAVIVGAGPAGAAAATTLANAGLRAILLDGRPDAQTQPGGGPSHNHIRFQPTQEVSGSALREFKSLTPSGTPQPVTASNPGPAL